MKNIWPFDTGDGLRSASSSEQSMIGLASLREEKGRTGEGNGTVPPEQIGIAVGEDKTKPAAIACPGLCRTVRRDIAGTPPFAAGRAH
jgi:hypothetical protein